MAASLLLLALVVSAPQADGEPKPRTPALEFDTERSEEPLEFRYSLPDDPYLATLRKQYRLDRVVAGARTELDKVRLVNGWVHGRWRHDGSSVPTKDDPISILEEAKTGKQFRCVEYGIVVSGCLAAIGVPCRVLALKIRDCETSSGGAGHVVAEAWLRDRQKWVLIDPQWNMIAMAGGKPLSAVELQAALARPQEPVEDDPQRDTWLDWIARYLYHFDVRFDQRILASGVDWGQPGLMLVPSGAKKPRKFQNHPLRNLTYTHSTGDFYRPPVRETARERGK